MHFNDIRVHFNWDRLICAFVTRRHLHHFEEIWISAGGETIRIFAGEEEIWISAGDERSWQELDGSSPAAAAGG